MISITHVLCPIDLSDISRHAFDHAAAIAHWYQARLTILYVFTDLRTMDVPDVVLEAADRQRVTNQMRQFAAAIPAGVVVDYRIQEAAFAHDEIVAQADAVHADLLVIGTHGRSGFQRLFLGSVTEKVIRKATCPTLVVPPRAKDVAMDAPVQFRRILCPIDFSDSSLDALDFAASLAEEADARLTVLHVVDIPAVLSEEPIVVEADLARFREGAVRDARRHLEAFIPERARTYCTVETTVVEGRAYREILRTATDSRSDLIVMGVLGRGALDLLVFGSTTHHVIRAAACPVLVVRRR